MRTIQTFGVAVLVASTAVAQTAFDVATIKPTDPDYRGGTIDTPPGGTLVSKGIPLRDLIAFAYDINVRQLSGGPGWLESEPYDVIGKVADLNGALGLDQARPLLQALFVERLNLVVRMDKKEMPVYILAIAKKGHKLRARKENIGTSDLNMRGTAKMASLPARNATMGDFRVFLQNGVLDRPVLDRTALTGRFDFDLKWDANSLSDSRLPSLFTAVQEQLGLKLEPQRAIADVLVIEHVERPSEN